MERMAGHMSLRRILRAVAVVGGLGWFLFVGDVVMSDLMGHMRWQRAHRILLDLNEPDPTDRETRLREAEKLLKEAIRSSPHRAEMRFDLGVVARNLVELYRDRGDAKSRKRMERYAELAETSHARAVALSRDNRRYRLALAWAALERQLFVKRRLSDADFRRLDTLFRAASKRAPHDPAVQFSCGCFWLMGDRVFDRPTRARAIQAFAGCIAADPDRWLPQVRDKFTAEAPSVEEMYLLVGPRRHLLKKLRPRGPLAVTKLRHHVVSARSAP